MEAIMLDIGLSLLAGLAIGLLAAGLVSLNRIKRRDRELAGLKEEKIRLETTLDQESKTAEEKLASLEKSRADLTAALNSLSIEKTRLETTLKVEKEAAEEKLAFTEKTRTALSNEFKALSSNILNHNSETFLKLASDVLKQVHEGDLKQRQQAIEKLVGPIKESLDKVNTEVKELENTRQRDYGSLRQQLTSLNQTQENLRKETGHLVMALKAPAVRGQWGEIQLKRVVELAGMVAHCDFMEQESAATETGRLRPDLVVKLPGGKNIIVDAKVPLKAYMAAMETQDEASRAACLKDHARLVRDHISKLSARGYWEQFRPTPEFVVMFLPAESIFSLALEHDPSLIEEGVRQSIIVASPTTLIALLRAAHYGWQQEAVAENAQKISELGRDIYERLQVLAEHFTRLGRGLDNAVDYYNKAVRSLETRVLPAARRFPDLTAESGKTIPEIRPVERTAIGLQAPELVETAEENEHEPED